MSGLVTESNVSSQWAGEFTVAKIISLAWKKARMINVRQEPDAQEQAFARDILNLSLDALQAEGKIVRQVEMRDVTVTAGTAAYALADDVIDVIGDAMMVFDTYETPLRMMGRGEWQLISNKETEGQPSRYYPEKGAVVTLRLYPVPDADATLRIQAVRLLKDVTATNETLDLERHWVRFMVADLAYEIAVYNSQPLDLCQLLRREADGLKDFSRAQAKQRGPAQFVIGHRTGWNR